MAPVSLCGIPATANPPENQLAIHVSLPPVLTRTIDHPDGSPRYFTDLTPQSFHASNPPMQKTEIIVRARCLATAKKCPCLAVAGSKGCFTGRCWVAEYEAGDVRDVKDYGARESQKTPDAWFWVCGYDVDIVSPGSPRRRTIYLVNPA